jgi:CRP-like cAMP-binding protein
MKKAISDEQVAWLTEKIIKSDGPGWKIAHVRADETFFKKGETVTRIGFVLKGQIRVDAMRGGKTATHEILGPQSTMGESAIGGGIRVHRHTAVATKDSDVLVFPLATLPKLLEDLPPLRDIIRIGMANHLDALHDALEDYQLNSAEDRLARVFLEHFIGKHDVDVLHIKTTPTRLAERIGRTRQTVTNIVKKKFRHAVQHERKDLYVVHKKRLEAFLDRRGKP